MARARRFGTGALMLGWLAAAPAAAQTIAQNTQSTGSTGTYFRGQAFTTGDATSYNTIAFSFLDASGAAEPATGNLYLFTSECSDTTACRPSKLAMDGAYATAAATGNQFSFSPDVTLNGATTYYAYADTRNPAASGDAQYRDASAGTSYVANSATGYFYTYAGTTHDFRVTGIAVATPEPASWALMILGFGLAGAVLRRRGRVLPALT